MKLWKSIRIQTFKVFGARKLECGYRSCLVQFAFLGRTRAMVYGEDISAAPYAQFGLTWLDTAHALLRYEALQESLEDDYTLFVVEKDGLALIKSNIAILLRE